MKDFSWLHLTDLHFGGKAQHWLWPGVKEMFFDDLERLHDKCGPWDLLVITGDLTQQGGKEEFDQVDEVLHELKEHLLGLGSSPRLLTVPGNHDLVRPEIKNLAVRLLKRWQEESDIREEFWEELESPYRQVVAEAFENYAEWQKRQEKQPGLTPGLLPGDFSATIEKQGVKLGIVGFNTAFLQLTADDYAGKLVVDARQFHHACSGDGPAWTKQHHACILLTHHPSTWLAPDSQQHVNGEIMAHGRFAVHLCGHMHEAAAYKNIAEAGSEARRVLQGRSLFSLKSFGRNSQRLHGYTAGKIELEGDDGKLIFWPREARLQGGEHTIVPDYSFKLREDLPHTEPVKFKLLQPAPPVTGENRENDDKNEEQPQKCDIFVSYAQEDDDVFSNMSKGWVTTLIDGLHTILTQKLKRAGGCVLRMDGAPRDTAPIPSEVAEQLNAAAILLIISSRAYLASKRFHQVHDIFSSKARQNSGGVFVVERESLVYPENFVDIRPCRYQFWMSADGQSSAKPISSSNAEYHQKLLDLGEELAAGLHLVSSPGETDSRAAVFLAEVTDELQEHRYEVKRYLEQRNIKVLPGARFIFSSAGQLERAIDDELDNSTLFIQLLTVSQYPERTSIPQMQYARAQAVKNLPILQWRDRNLNLTEVADKEQRKFLNSDTVTAMRMEEFKEYIIKRLIHIEKEKSQKDLRDVMVFIDTARQDMGLAHEIKDFLEKNEIACSLPIIEDSATATSSEIREDLEENLKYCHAVIVPYGAAPLTWVRRRLLYCHYMQAKRKRPLKVIAVCPWLSSVDESSLGMSIHNLRILVCPTLQASGCLPDFIDILAK